MAKKGALPNLKLSKNYHSRFFFKQIEKVLNLYTKTCFETQLDFKKIWKHTLLFCTKTFYSPKIA